MSRDRKHDRKHRTWSIWIRRGVHSGKHDRLTQAQADERRGYRACHDGRDEPCHKVEPERNKSVGKDDATLANLQDRSIRDTVSTTRLLEPGTYHRVELDETKPANRQSAPEAWSTESVHSWL